MKSNKVLAFVLAFIALFAITVPTTALADGGGSAETPLNFSKLYFITDSSEFYDYECDVVTEAGARFGLNSDKIITLNLAQTGQSEYSFHIIDELSQTISNNSLVIIEIKRRITPECFVPKCNGSPVDHLENAFYCLKLCNCKIIFISGTDEETMQSLNDDSPDYLKFLDYVDVHVNVDFMFMLAKGFIYQVDLSSNGDPVNCCFFIDDLLSNPRSSDGDFAKKWIMPYLDEKYQELYSQYTPTDNDPVNSFWTFLFYELGIRIYGQFVPEDTMVLNYLTGEYNSSIPSFMEDEIERSYAVAIADSSKLTGTWGAIVSSLNANPITKMVLYNEIVNLNQLNLNPILGVGETKLMFYGSATPCIGIFTFSDLVVDFMSGDDMNDYNNTYGRCAVTYTPITSGPNGWIPTNMPGEMRFYQVFDNIEEPYPLPEY